MYFGTFQFPPSFSAILYVTWCPQKTKNSRSRWRQRTVRTPRKPPFFLPLFFFPLRLFKPKHAKKRSLHVWRWITDRWRGKIFAKVAAVWPDHQKSPFSNTYGIIQPVSTRNAQWNANQNHECWGDLGQLQIQNQNLDLNLFREIQRSSNSIKISIRICNARCRGIWVFRFWLVQQDVQN